MATRHQVREAVISLLYAEEMGSEMEEFKYDFLEEHKIRNNQKDFALKLFEGINEKLEEIDEIINSFLKEYKLNEIGSMERAILRLGTYELKFTKTDNAVVINEAIELTKKFASETSPKFINGVLDAISKSE